MLQGESDVDRREMASWLCEAGEGHVLTKNRMHATLAIMGRCILEAIFQDSKFAFEKGGYICEQDCSQARELSYGPGVGLGFLPRLPPPTCARPVSGVGLGLSYYPASLLWSPGPRPSPVFRSAVCNCLSLNVSVSLRISSSRDSIQAQAVGLQAH